MTQFVGVVGSGMLGHDPFDRRTWSGLSYYFFTALKDKGALHRAFGVEAPKLTRYWLMAKNFRPSREAWRNRFYADPAYRDVLTEQVRRALRPDDFQHSFLQLGAFYDVPALARGKARCFSYHDGNLAERMRSPYAPHGLGARALDRALEYERKVYQGMTVVFPMSEYLRQSFIRDFGVAPERCVNAGGGINLERVPAYVPERSYESREILFIGVEFERKGGRELLSAFRKVREHYPQSRLHIVGPRELSIPEELGRGVVYHGYLSRSDPAGKAKTEELFRTCALFAMPSLYEPFGVAPLEAMANQLPCLLTNRWALAEMVTPGVNGDLVEPGGADDVEAKLLGLLADPDRLRRMGDAGRQRVLDYYTWDKVADRIVAAANNAPPPPA